MANMQVRKIDSAEGNVSKFVFTKSDAVFEAVLYRYPDFATRTVICCSTMSGCPIGCRFCGAGDYFVRRATAREIVEQVEHCISQTDIDPTSMKRLQIMFMSMGEPLLNRDGLELAILQLHHLYPAAALLVSTIGPRVDYEWLHNISQRVPTVGLQFSIHETDDQTRDALIPFKAKLSLDEIAAVGAEWASRTGRRPFFNYCAAEHNSGEDSADRIVKRFDPQIWNATVSVVCERNEGLPARSDHQRNLASAFANHLVARGYDVRVFDPAGQDDIGGGCGQLWFVQQWMQDNPSLARPSIGCGKPIIHAPHARNLTNA